LCLGAPGLGTPCCGSSGVRGLRYISSGAASCDYVDVPLSYLDTLIDFYRGSIYARVVLGVVILSVRHTRAL